MASSKSLDKFNGQGFHTWQTKVKGYLMKKNLWSIVKIKVEDETTSVSTRAMTAANQARDEQALGIIITALDDNYIHYVDDAETSSQAWEILEKMFGTKAKHSKISLKMQLYGLKMEPNENVSSLINRLKSLMTQLTYVKAPVDEEDAIAILLKSMPSNFDQIVTVLKEKEPIPSMESVINSLQEEEKKTTNNIYIGEGAFAVHNNMKKCNTCGKTNHATKDCYLTKPCVHCGKTGHPHFRCFHKNKDKGKEDKANITINEEEANTAEEIITSHDDSWAF